jgi:DDE superfamily endonuclease
VEFLIEVVERAPAGEAHIILDNLSAHKSQVIRDFLATHLNVHFHFTPTYSSWRARREPCHSQAVAYESLGFKIPSADIKRQIAEPSACPDPRSESILSFEAISTPRDGTSLANGKMMTAGTW